MIIGEYSIADCRVRNVSLTAEHAGNAEIKLSILSELCPPFVAGLLRRTGALSGEELLTLTT